MILDMLDYLVAIATVILAYRLFIERARNGKRMSELKGLTYSLVSCLIALWLINIFIGFIK